MSFNYFSTTYQPPANTGSTGSVGTGSAGTGTTGTPSPSSSLIQDMLNSTGYDFSGGSGSSTYTVRAGDSLSSIAATYGTTVSQILAANPQITNANLISVGETINIPTGSANNMIPIYQPVNTGLLNAKITATGAVNKSTLSTGGLSSLLAKLVSPPIIYFLVGGGALLLFFGMKPRRKRRKG